MNTTKNTTVRKVLSAAALLVAGALVGSAVTFALGAAGVVSLSPSPAKAAAPVVATPDRGVVWSDFVYTVVPDRLWVEPAEEQVVVEPEAPAAPEVEAPVEKPTAKPKPAPAPKPAPPAPKPTPTPEPTPTPTPKPSPPPQIPAKFEINGNYIPWAQCDGAFRHSHTVGWGGTSLDSRSFSPDLPWSATVSGPTVTYYVCLVL